MKRETLSILKKVKNGELTPQVAQKQLFVLFGISGCFTIGAKIQITECIHGHEYEIGEVVTIIDHEEENNQTTSWLCRNFHGKEWYINEEEGIPLNNR